MSTQRYTPEDIVKSITTSDLGSGGLLPPENQKKLARSIIDNSTLLKPGGGVRTMNPSQLSGDMDSIHVHGPVVSGSASESFGSGDQAAALSKLYDNTNHRFRRVSWTTKKVRATLGWTPETLAQGIEGASLSETVNQMFTARISHDLEDLAINGDTTLTDSDHPLGALRVLQDGYEVKSRAGVITDAAGAFVGQGLFEACFKRLPQHVRRERPGLRWMYNDDVEIDYRALLSNRMDVQGTDAIRGSSMAPLGIKAQLVPMFPSDLSCRTTGATPALLQGVRHGPFIFDKGVNDQIKFEINGAAAFVTVNFASAAVGIPAVASGKYTRLASEVAAIINAALVAHVNHGTAFADVAGVDPRTDRLILKSPTTGAASTIRVDGVGGGIGVLCLDLLGLGKEDGAVPGLYDDPRTGADTVSGAAAGANTVREGTFVLLTEPANLGWILVVSPDQNGIKMATEYNKDRDRWETIMHAHVGNFIDGLDRVGRISNLRTNLTPA